MTSFQLCKELATKKLDTPDLKKMIFQDFVPKLSKFKDKNWASVTVKEIGETNY